MIFQYEVINPKTVKTLPHYNKRGEFIIPNIHANYKYYIEAARYNNITLNREYYFLFSKEKFDAHCRQCRVDDYGRLHLRTHGEIDTYIRNENITRGNVNVEYLESDDTYDVYIIT